MIKLNQVNMYYNVYQDKITSLKSFFVSLMTGKIKKTKFHALDGITLDIKKGEIIGLVGENGAGKSTMLKLIAGIMKPSSGEIKVEGSVVPMLELGSGFDYDLTGKENIFLNGAILGYSKKFIYQKYEEIVSFSELEGFIDTPIRNYSSGMIVRLAFSIATVVNPEVLIVDEILGVGDESFQIKSYKRMMDLMSKGTTVLVVSHDLNQIRKICDRVIWLSHGKIIEVGETNKICDKYSIEMRDKK